MNIYGPSDIIPLHWALDDTHLPLFHESMDTVVLSRISKQDFKQGVNDNPVLLRAALAALLESFRRSQERIKNLELPTAKERIAYRLLFLGAYYGHKKSHVIEIDAPIAYKDLAESLVLTRETVNRIMKQFAVSGLVKRTDHHITILKPEEIKNILGEEVTLDI